MLREFDDKDRPERPAVSWVLGAAAIVVLLALAAGQICALL